MGNPPLPFDTLNGSRVSPQRACLSQSPVFRPSLLSRGDWNVASCSIIRDVAHVDAHNSGAKTPPRLRGLVVSLRP
jgi:hypothetical protein